MTKSRNIKNHGVGFAENRKLCVKLHHKGDIDCINSRESSGKKADIQKKVYVIAGELQG